MKVIAFSGSPIRNGNLESAIGEILAGYGGPPEFVRLAELQIRPCIGCLKCASTNRCVQKDDMGRLLDKMEAADFLIKS
ncbi:MAG: flavodoxin family protein [Bacillota bacterium]